LIEPEDLIFPETAPHPSTFVTSESAMHSIVSKLKALESTPVIGAFDANHLQQIHACIFEDVLPRPGQLRVPRPSSLSSSLDSLFDRLVMENRLKGLELDTWSRRATDYLREIERINPFDEGSDLASIELFRELATENGLTLRWAPTSLEFSRDEVEAHMQSLQSANLRRLLMLVVDDDLSKPKSIPVRNRHYSLDLFLFP
jgi:fido (protein-threonine AMPylation protein)